VGSTIEIEQADSVVLLYDPDGRSANAAAIEAGLALIPQEHEASLDVPAALLAAIDRARSDRVGLHNTVEPCTAVSMLTDAGLASECVSGAAGGGVSVAASPSPFLATRSTPATSMSAAGPPASSVALQVNLDKVDARWVELARLSTGIHDHRSSVVWRALSVDQRATCQDLINDGPLVMHQRADIAQDLADTRAREAEAARIAEEERIAEVEAARVAEEQRKAEAARIAEEQRIAAEAEAARVVEEKRIAAEAEAARIAAQAEASRAAQSQPSQSQSRGGSGSGSSGGSDDRGSNSRSSGGGSGDLSGYTGPRCYAPGGKTWKPC
jgi:hypothetical protein